MTRRSRTITLTVLSGLMLTACVATNFGCGRNRPVAADHSWYDANGNRIEQKWKTDAQGNQARDDAGRPIPDPHVPYDNYGRPWVYTNGVWAPLPPPGGYGPRSSSSTWLWGGSGYRSTGGSSYHPTGSTSSSSPSRSSSSPSASSPSRSSSSSSPSSISRGGFGSTGAGMSSSS